MVLIKRFSKFYLVMVLIILLFPIAVTAEKDGNKKGVPTQLSALEEQIKSLATKLEEQQTLITSLEEKVNEQGKVIQEQNQEIASLSEQLQFHTQGFANYKEDNNNRIDEMNEQLGSTVSELGRLDGIIQTILQHIENLQNLVEGAFRRF